VLVLVALVLIVAAVVGQNGAQLPPPAFDAEVLLIKGLAAAANA
jgi:hypothetical protein